MMHKHYFRYTLFSILLIVVLFVLFSPLLVRVGINIGNYFAKGADVTIQASGISGNIRNFKIESLSIKMPGKMVQIQKHQVGHSKEAI